MPKILWLIPAGLLVLALAPMPYGFYTILRIAVCGLACFLAWTEHQRFPSSIWIWLLGCMALLFNPLIPIHMPREIWAPLDVGSAIILLIHMWTFNRRAQPEGNGPDGA